MAVQGKRYEPRNEQMENEICRIAGHWLNLETEPEDNPVLVLGRGKKQIMVLNRSTYEKLVALATQNAGKTAGNRPRIDAK